MIGYYYKDSVNTSLSHQVTNTYDALNRLTKSTGSAVFPGTLSYNFPLTTGDRWNNSTCNGMGNPSGPGLTCGNITFSSSTNRITTSGYGYDAAGNLTSDPLHNYAWDAENRLTSIDISKGGPSFTYNAYGWRVYNSSGSLSYVLDPSGQFLEGLFNGGGTSAIPLGGRILAQYQSNGANFSHVNAQGSETQNTDYAGNGGQTILYYPTGQVLANPSGSYPNNLYQIFGSLQLADTTTDGYVPPFRYYIPEQGRWLTPDPLAGDITDPQSLNRYAYVGNNPTSLIDPLGLGPCDTNPNSAACNHDPHFNDAVGSGMGGNCYIDGLAGPCIVAQALLNMGAACIGSCTSTVTGPNGLPYQVVQTAGPTVYTGPNGEELSDESVAELGLPALGDTAGPAQPIPGDGPSGGQAGGGRAGCGQKVLGLLQKNLGNSVSVSAPGAGTLQGGHFSFNFTVTFTSGGAAQSYAAAASTSFIFGLDTGFRSGVVPSLHTHLLGLNGPTSLNITAHLDWFNPRAGFYLLAPLHIGFDVGLGQYLGSFGLHLPGC